MAGPYVIQDHPVIRNMERTGYPDGRAPREYVCPVCGAECETVYTNQINQAVGCDICLDGKDVYDYYEEMEE